MPRKVHSGKMKIRGGGDEPRAERKSFASRLGGTKSRAALALAVSLWLASGGVVSAEEVESVDSETAISESHSDTVYKLTKDGGVAFTVENGGNVKAIFSEKSGNTITVKSGGTVSDRFYFEQSSSASITGGVSDNNVTIESDATVSYRVQGGYSADGAATGNTVTVHGTVKSDVYGGKAGPSGSASRNYVIVDGGTVNGGVNGGYAGGTATRNTVELHDATVASGVRGGGGTETGDITTGNTLILSGENKVQSGVYNFEIIKFDSANLTWDTTKPVLKAQNFYNCGKLDVSEVTEKATANGTMTLLQTTGVQLTDRLKIGNTSINTTGVKVKDEAKSNEASGVTLDYNLTHTVKLANADGMTNNAITYNVANVMNSISFGEMTWGEGRTLTAGDYDFANVTNANIDTTNLKFTSPEDVTGSMTLLSNATGLAAGDNIAHSQDFTKTVNGATLSATLNGNVTRTTGAIGYTTTGTTLDSVNLAGWDGAAGVAVTADDTFAPSIEAGASRDILTATAGYFANADIGAAIAYQAYDFTNDEAQGVTHSGAQSKGVKTNEDKSALVYAVGKMDVKDISLGAMTWDTGRTATTDYDFANVAAIDANGLSFTFIDTQKAALSATSNMTLLDHATNLAAGKTVTGANRTQTIDYNASNGAALSGTLTGELSTTAGAVNYQATGMTLDSVNLAGWDGTASAVPTGWTKNASGVAVTAADFTAPTIDADTSKDILTTNTENFFSDEKITGAMKYAASVASSDTENGVTLTGAESKGVKIAENGKNLVYARSNFTVSNISLGEMTWGAARDASGTGYNYANAAVDLSGFTFANPEAIAAGNTTLLQANDTLAAIAEAEKNIAYQYSPVAGVTLDGQILGSYETTDAHAIQYTATENKANKLTFGDVEWKDSGALLDHATTLSHVSFNGADVDTANINFTNISELDANKKMTLVSSFGDTVGTITGTKYKVGSTLEGEGKASLSGNDLIFTAETGTPKPAPTPTPMPSDDDDNGGNSGGGDNGGNGGDSGNGGGNSGGNGGGSGSNDSGGSGELVWKCRSKPITR